MDLFLIAPASATTLSRCAAGAADTLLTNCYPSFTGPVAFAPAMAPAMWAHPAVRRNVERLKEHGATILPMGMGYSIAAGKLLRSSMCSYQDMWPRLKALVEAARVNPPAPQEPA